MKKVLSVINCHQKLELKRFTTLKSKGIEYDLEIFGISRFTKNELGLFPIFETTRSNYRLDSLDIYLKIFIDILEKEIRADRLFCRIGDFSSPSIRYLPNNLQAELKLVATNILNTFELIKPDYVMLGHPDNWIANSISQLCDILEIKSGLAMELFPSLKYYLCTFNLTHSHPLMSPLIFNTFKNTDYKNLASKNFLDRFEIGKKSKRSLQPNTKIKKVFSVLINFFKRELYAMKNINFRKKNNYKRWKYIDTAIPILDSFVFAIFRFRGFFNRVIYLLLSKRGLKLFNSTNKARRIIYLHAAPEAATCWYKRTYINQVNLVQEVVNVCHDEEVFVKEHPVQGFYLRKLFFYFQIRALGASFLPRNFSPFSVMSEKDALITISGTVALEASVKGKNCFIAYEEIWYNALPFIQSFSNLAGFNLCRTVNGDFKSLSIEEIVEVLLQNKLGFMADSDDDAQMVACKIILENSAF